MTGVPLSGMTRAEAVGEHVRRQALRVWPDGDHSIYNQWQERTSFVSDWFADRLTQMASV